MGCVSVVKCITKAILFLLNLVFTIFGFALAITAIILYIKLKDLVVSSVDKEKFMESNFQWLAIIVICLGLIIFIIAFCGCVGSITENKWLLITYAIFMLAIISGESYVAIKYNDLNVIQRPVDTFMKKAFVSKTDKVTFRIFEVTIHCCGTDGPDSYLTLLPAGQYHPRMLAILQQVVPATCCAKKATSLKSVIELYHKFTDIAKSSKNDDKTCLKKDAVQVGCLNETRAIIEKYCRIIQKLMIAIIVVEVLEFVASIFLCFVRSQRNKSEKGYY